MVLKVSRNGLELEFLDLIHVAGMASSMLWSFFRFYTNDYTLMISSSMM